MKYKTLFFTEENGLILETYKNVSSIVMSECNGYEGAKYEISYGNGGYVEMDGVKVQARLFLNEDVEGLYNEDILSDDFKSCELDIREHFNINTREEEMLRLSKENEELKKKIDEIIEKLSL